MRQQAAIGIGTATGQGHQSTNMFQHPADKVLAQLAQPSTLIGSIEQVLSRMLTIFCSPQAKVNMCPTACLIEERLRRKSSEQVKVSRYSTRRFAHKTYIICCTQYIGVANREFLLCWTKLSMEQFNRNTLCFQSC